MFEINYVSAENKVVYFESEYSNFKAFFKTETYPDVSMNGEIETLIEGRDIIVDPNAFVIFDTDGTDDGEILREIRLTDKECRELADLIDMEI